MSVLKVKINGQWVSIPSIKGERGERGLPGQDADPTVLIDDTSGFGDLDKVLSSNELMTRLLQKASVIIANESGKFIILDDAIPDQTIRNMKVSFIPKQSGSGDPSPTNIRPISGMTGINTFHPFSKNLLDVNEEKRLSLNSSYSNWSSSNGVVTITGNSTGGYIMPCLPETDYVYSFDTTYRGGNLTVRVYEFSQYPTSLSNGTLVYNSDSNANKPPAPFTTTANGHWLVVGFYAHHSENITIQNMQVEFGTTATEFEPYVGSFFPIVFPVLGKNLFDGQYVTGYLNSNNFITSGTNAKSAVIPCEPNTTYTIKKYESSNRFQIATSSIYPDGGECSGYVFPGDSQMEYTYTTGADAHYLIVYVSSSSEQATPQMMINVGSTAEPYEPYTNTIYGGSFDFVTGVLTVEWLKLNLSERYYDYYETTSGHLFRTTVIQGWDAKANTSNFYINTYRITTQAQRENLTASVSADGRLDIIDDNYSDSNSFKAALAEMGAVLVYHLATPQTIQLDPAAFVIYDGDNVFFTDADNILISYAVDTKKYVDKGSSDIKGFKVNGIDMIGQNGDVNLVTQPWAYGLGINSSSGLIYIAGANSDALKAGSSNYLPVTAGRQHESAFYALAKLAGVDLASVSGLTVGQWPNNAKAAIANMLGLGQIYSPMELITHYTVPEDTRELIINTDQYGEPFKLAHAEVILIFGTQAPGINDYIRGDLYDQNNVRRTLPTLRLISTSHTWLVYNFVQFGGLAFSMGKATSSGNAQNIQLSTYQYASGFNSEVLSVTAFRGVRFTSYDETTTPIIANSQVLIYGCKVIE